MVLWRPVTHVRYMCIMLILVLKEPEDPKLSFDTSFVCISVVIATQNAKALKVWKNLCRELAPTNFGLERQVHPNLCNVNI